MGVSSMLADLSKTIHGGEAEGHGQIRRHVGPQNNLPGESMSRIPVVPQEKELAEIQEIFNHASAPNLVDEEAKAITVFLDSLEESLQDTENNY